MEKEMNEETVEAFFHKYQFLTLSTCRTGEGRDARLLVIGCRKKVREDVLKSTKHYGCFVEEHLRLTLEERKKHRSSHREPIG